MAESTRSGGAATTDPVQRLADTRAQVLLELLEREVRGMGLEATATLLHDVFWRSRQAWAHGAPEPGA